MRRREFLMTAATLVPAALAGIPALAAIYDPVGPVASIAAYALRFAVHQFAAACVLDGDCRDQHRRGGDHPGLGDRVPKLSLERRRPVVPHSLPPRKGAGQPDGQRAVRSQQKRAQKRKLRELP